MRATTKTAVLSSVLVGVMATAAVAAAPTLEGKFKVTATIGANDFGIDQGTKTKETYKFKCANESCSEVNLTRTDPGGKYKSTLKKSGSNYVGKEDGPYPSCPDNAHATFTVDHELKVTDDQDGQATAISGTAKTKIQNCEFASFTDYKIKGKLK